MKKKLSFWGNIAVFTLCVALVIAASFYALSVRQLNVVYTPADSKESTADITNPFCGFYKINGYVLAEDKTARDADIWCQRSCKDTPYPLMLLEINLRNYADQDLSANALSQLNRIFKICEKKKKQIILRFLYDWDGKAQKTEPSDFYRIKNHIQQVSATVNAHADCIYILQGLFIGNNGEMNNTNYGDIDQMRQLAETLAKNISPSIYLAVRTPAQLRGILYSRTPMAGQSDEGSLASRLGLFNDGMLGSVYDLGTYDDTPLTSASEFNEQGTRSEELLFQNKLCQYVPNGGEVTIDNKYNNLDNAISDLSTMCVSYLNSDHDLAVLNKWKNSTYTGSGVFSGCSGYDYIRAHLCYRYFIKSSSLDFHAFMSDKASLYLTIENVGFAPAYRQFDTALILTNQETGESRRMKTEIDNRSIAGSDQSEFKIELDVRSFAKGSYQVNLEMKDPYTRQVIHFANTGSEESATVSVGRLVIP